MFVLKAIVSFGSLYIISRSIVWKDVGEALKHAQYLLMFLALVVFWVAQVFSSLRCVYVARTLGGALDLSTSLRAHFVGLWFNQVLPTSLGGDVIKMAILRKPLGLSLAIRSVILDRLSGFIFLLLATAVTLPLYAKLFPSHLELVIGLGFIVIGGGLAIILGAWAAHRISKLDILNPVFRKLTQIFSDVWAFRKGTSLWEQAWTSAIVHFSGIVTYMFLGFAFGIKVDFIIFFLVVPIVFLIALIPISFAGWGIREAGSILMFGMVGVEKEISITISISFGLLLVVAGLPGLITLALKKS
jgi:uncharacterized protein (TIRG00374 family)